MEKFNRFLDEARIAPPSTRGEAGFDKLMSKILQDDNVPEKAKQLLTKPYQAQQAPSLKPSAANPSADSFDYP